VDIQEIDGASNRGIDEIRELRENVRYLPASAKIKVYIIDEIHMLTPPAFNALLKTLEEPPEHVIFVFATTEVHKVPQTILSRCQRFDFRPIPAGLIAAQFEAIAAEEALELEPEAIALLARAAKGSMRDGLSLLDQTISFAGRQVSEKDVREVLGLVDPRLVRDLAGAVLSGEAAHILARIDEVAQHGYDLRTFYGELLAHFRNLIVLKVDPEAAMESLGLSPTEVDEFKSQADQATPETVQLCLQGLLDAGPVIRGATQPRFGLELALLKLSHQVPVVGLESIILKLEQFREELGASAEMAPPALKPAEQKAAAGPPPPPAAETRAGGEEEDEEDETEDEEPLDSAPEGGVDLCEPLSDWPRFLAYLKGKEPRLAAHLDQAKPVRLEKGRLVLENGSAFDFLDDEERRQSLEKLATDFFKRPLSLSLVQNHQEPPKNNHVQNRRQLQKEALAHPLVKEACELIDGQAIEVKPVGDKA